MEFAIYLLAYLLGSISFSYLFVRIFKGKDIRSLGSKNAGATNVIRTQGLAMGLATVLFDILKGSLACFISYHYKLGYPLVAAFFAILGHCYPIYFSFKGGKGVATTIGCLGYLYPHYIPIGTFIFFAIAFATKYVSVASIGLLIAAIILIFSGEQLLSIEIVAGLGILALVVIRHKDNIKRLINGNENKFTIGGKK